MIVYAGFDLDHCKVVACGDWQRLCLHLYVNHTKSHVEVAARKAYSTYNRYNTKTLLQFYNNTSEKKYTGSDDRPSIIEALMALVCAMPRVKESLTSLEAKAGRTVDSETAPQPPKVGFVSEAVMKYRPILPPAPATQVSALSPSGKIKRERTSTPQPRAARSGVTKLVWCIADEILAEQKTTNLGSIKEKVMERCKKEGIHPGTAQVQFGKWRKSKL